MRLPVLMYHAVDPQPSLISIRPEMFAWQMSWLYYQGYQVISLGDLTGILAQGGAIPAATIVLTFDDGLESLYSYAYPVLAEYGFPATIFLVAGYCGGLNNWPSQPAGVPGLRLLDWDQIRKMDQNKIEFGAHTISHPRLDQLSSTEAEKEIRDSKTKIEEQIGHTVTTFAYPYGRYTPQIKELVSRSFQGACSTNIGFVESRSDRFAIQRIDINYYKSPVLFRQLFSVISPPYIAARSLVRKAAGKLMHRQWY